MASFLPLRGKEARWLGDGRRTGMNSHHLNMGRGWGGGRGEDGGGRREDGEEEEEGLRSECLTRHVTCL